MNVSVIIPSFNRRAVLSRALHSVYAQSLPALEVIVVDDGSTDGTDEMVQTRFPQVTYVYQPNGGVSAARNNGIRLAQSEWIALIDSDDEWRPEKLRRQYEALVRYPDFRVCHTEEIWIRRGKRVNAKRIHAKAGGWIFQHCLPLCAMSPSSILIHRDVFDEVGLFDETLPACEDYDLWLRITAKYPVLFIPNAQIIKYGGHDDQLSNKHPGMDRFRIYALEKIVQSGILSATNRQAAVDMLLKKIHIYCQGAEKRQKYREVDFYRQLINYYSVV